MKRMVCVAAALAACACGGEGGADSVASAYGGFCAEVQPSVAAFLERSAAAHPTPDDPRYGGTLVVGAIGEISDGMMALTTSDNSSSQHQEFVNLTTLIDYDAAFEPRPYLAESWEVNDATTEITFHLRRDVFWHDGEPTTARDVAFTYLRATDPRTGFPNAPYFANYVPGAEGVEVVDDYTLRVRLRPHAQYMDPWRALPILPEHLLGEVPPEDLRGHPYGLQCPVGNGPFVFQEHRQDGQWVFAANPAHPSALGGRPFVDRYVFRYVPEQSTLLNELLTGGVDVYMAPRIDQVEQIVGSPGAHLVRAPSRNFVFVGWNSRRPQLADARVRRAITMATDRQQIVDALLLGYGTVANSTLLPVHWAYDPAQPSALPFDPAGARALLDAAGWIDRDEDGVRENADGLPLSISILYNQGNEERKRIAEIMQVQLRDVGIEIRPEVMEFGALVARITDTESRDFDGVGLAWVGEFRVDDTGLFHSSGVDAPYGFSGTRNAELDRLIDTLALVQDPDQARPLWARYEEELRDEQPFTFFYFTDRLMGVRDRVQGLRLDPRGEWVNVKDWWLDRGSP
ncbi:MAG TPA: ABC transporter substrate-binding protein [Longimicrobiales bacterium]|nr:ABC transporter substrate-binding protein [Longimicrobiales bacterium]